MQHITIYDYLLLPLYLFLFYIIVKRKSLKIADIELRKIFLIAFALRMFGSIGYSLMVQYYYGYGDSFTYYEGGDFIIDQIRINFNNIKYLFAPATELQRFYSLENGKTGGLNGYIAIPSAVAIMKLSAVTSILTFNNYLITSLLFGLFSFAGQWKLFQVFNDINKGKHQKLLAFAVLYTPALWFWGSGLLKESICLGGMGFIISILYNGFVKKRTRMMDWIILALLVYLVFKIKDYFITLMSISLLLTIVFVFLKKIKVIILKGFFIILTLTTIIYLFSVSDFSEQINSLAEESVMQIQNFQKNYKNAQQEDETSKAGFEMAGLNPTVGGILIKGPTVIISSLFRPYLWESKKLIILFSSLENALLLLSTLYVFFKTRIFGVLKQIFTNPYIFFCFIFSILLAAMIGFTTFNFGTLVRYKILFLPFYYFMLVMLYTKAEEKKLQKKIITLSPLY